MRAVRSGPVAWILTIAFAVIAIACGDSDQVLTPEVTPFYATLTIQDNAREPRAEFKTGEPVVLVLSIRNLSSKPQSLEFQDAFTHDYVVSDTSHGGTWIWSHDRAFAQTATELEFAPGQNLELTAVWNQTDDDDNPVAPGDFDARAYLQTDVPGTTANPVRFRIR